MTQSGNQTQQKVAILDAGSQFGKVIDRKVRELHVESELLPLNTPAVDLGEYAALIISGGPNSIDDANAPEYDPSIFKLGKPVLGICYGMYLVNVENGGSVTRKERREDGPCEVKIDTSSKLFTGLATEETVLMSHGDTLDTIAPNFEVVATSGDLVAAIENPTLNHYAVQFHPEVDLTVHGKEMLANFLFSVAELEPSFELPDRLQNLITSLKQEVGSNNVLVLVSGGVDSTVCATLLAKAIPAEQITAVHIDNGLLRKNESKGVIDSLKKAGVSVVLEEAQETFLNATTTINGQETNQLSQENSPEAKRHIIGDTFMAVSQKVMAEVKLDPETTLLAQGTLRPDLIESASAVVSTVADKIKTHHNDTDLVRALRDAGKVIEPLKDYHKDEVRQLGSLLGLPDELVWRQPFPGPGLGIRILCADEPYQTDNFATINRTLAEDFSDEKIGATLLPIQTVGVQGDGRTYSYAVGLYSKTDDHPSWDSLFERAREIPKQVHQVNRVVYIFGETPETPVTSITPTKVNTESLEQLRQADAIVNQHLLNHDLIRSLSQVPVVLFPVDFGQHGTRSIAIRTFITNDFMTGVPAVPGNQIPEHVLNEMVNEILDKVAGISRVVYDLTSKPPGTTEWE